MSKIKETTIETKTESKTNGVKEIKDPVVLPDPLKKKLTNYIQQMSNAEAQYRQCETLIKDILDSFAMGRGLETYYGVDKDLNLVLTAPETESEEQD